MIPRLIPIAALFGMVLLSPTSAQSAARGRPPNVIVIFIDDLGYEDIGVYGAEGFATPTIDQMAREGIRFTNFYASQGVCSASRASLLTGCYAERVSIKGALMPWANHGLNSEEETIAEVLQSVGYRTAAVGKWHLGHHREFLPLQHGFDEYLGVPYSNDMWPVDYDGTALTEERSGARPWKLKYPVLPLIEGNEKVSEIRTLEDQGTLTARYTERAVRFVRSNKDHPFFLYLAHSMVHVPLGVSGRFRGQSAQGMFGDVMMEIDWSVGEILDALRELHLDEDTIVIFTSDNGPWLNFGNHAGSADPLREGKGTSWEGGVRVPCIVRWPGTIRPNGLNDMIFTTMDFLPTICAITGAPLPKATIDGVDFFPVLKGERADSPRDHFFYYYETALEAVRRGKWKLHFPHTYRSYLGVELCRWEDRD
jgi:arylsulfatase